MKVLILGKDNIVPGSNNTRLRYNFVGGGVKLGQGAGSAGDQWCLVSTNVHNSWFNYDAQVYNNTVYQYIWIDGSVNTVTIPNSNLNIDDLNALFRSVMVTNTHYLVTNAGQQVFYLELELNPSRYAVQFNAFTVPTSAEATTLGYTQPPGATWAFPITTVTPQITILSTNNFGLTIGFNAGTYPTTPSATNFSKLSDISPQVSPISSVVMTLNLVSNDIASPDNLLYAFTTGETAFGQIIPVQPPEFSWIDSKEGYFTSLEVGFVDQNLNPMRIQDPQMTIILGLRRRTEVMNR
jgi:hypothetical protein